MTPPADPGPRAGARRRVAAIVLVAAAATLAVSIAARGPISQDEEYHAFADGRAWLGVPNAANVLSNLPFLAVGVLGFAALRRAAGTASPPARWERAGFLILSSGLAATAFGSALYHLAPRDATLVWDRIPMTLVFSSFVALLLGERLSPRVGRAALAPLLALGVGSVLYWAATLDGRRGDDLRPYVFVQSSAMLAAAVLVVLVPEPRRTRGPLILAFVAYVAAKQFEGWDSDLYRATGHLVSGHTLKHLAAAVAALFLVRWFSAGQAARAPSGAGRV